MASGHENMHGNCSCGVNSLLSFHQWTPVHVASNNDHPEIVQYLVDNGADDVGVSKYESA